MVAFAPVQSFALRARQWFAVDVKLHKIGKTYDGEHWAVRGVDLDIPGGSIFGLIGPNGAGKSTTLRMMATAMPPTEGALAFDGDAVPDDPTQLRGRIGFLGDGNPLYRHMTPTEYLRFFGQCYRLPAEPLERAIERTLDDFFLRDKADTPCGDLSKGMRQRVLIARALLHEPSLLILDEPADGLDPRGRSELRRVLKQIQARGVTIVVSSHILRELDDLCDQVAILQRGAVVVAGRVDDVIDRYEVSRFTYRLRMLAEPDAATALARAKEVLAAHRCLVEGEGVDEGLPALSVQVQGDEALMARVLAALVAGGVSVVTASRQRSRLEDVYDKISADRIN